MSRREEVEIKSRSQILLMREAGLVVARTLEKVRAEVASRRHHQGAGRGRRERDPRRGRDPVVPRLRRLRGPARFRRQHLRLGERRGGARDPRSAVLREGDLLSIDCGAILDGWHGDSAITVPVGEVAPEAAGAVPGVRGVAVGRPRRRSARRPPHRYQPCGRGGGPPPHRPVWQYGIVDNYGGHGIGTAMHQAPHLLNYGRPGRGQRLVKGLALAIEPMVTLASPDTRVLDDEWTVVTADGRWAAHWEHTVAITEDGPWVLTAFDGGVAKLAALGVRPASRETVCRLSDRTRPSRTFRSSRVRRRSGADGPAAAPPRKRWPPHSRRARPAAGMGLLRHDYR